LNPIRRQEHEALRLRDLEHDRFDLELTATRPD
jgi:hypothetical protein